MTSVTAPTARDFPDWLGPMLVKELRQGLKARAFVISFVALQVLMVLTMIYHALLYVRERQNFSTDGLNSIFWGLLGVQLLAVTPVRAFGALLNERKANTIELIFMTGLTPWRIALGKWASLFVQAVLFLLAVLPYTILRYFFGGVNLTEELIALGGMLLACGVFSAAGLAISGMPVFIRVIAICAAGLFAMSFLPMLLFAFAMRGSMGSSSFVDIEGWAWFVLVYNALLFLLAGLEVAASTIAPPAENHAVRQRLLALASCLPMFPMLIWKAPEEAVMSQLVIFMCVIALAAWHHLSVEPQIFRSHLEPFARRGKVATVFGSLFQPGWPSATLFVIVAIGIILAFSSQVHISHSDRAVVRALTIMATASLLTAPFLWRLIRRRSRWMLVEHTLFLGFCGAAIMFLQALKRPGATPFGHQLEFSLLPPLGFFAMLDRGLDGTWASSWIYAGVIATGALVVLLLVQAIPYWRNLLSVAAGIRTRSVRSSASQEAIP